MLLGVEFGLAPMSFGLARRLGTRSARCGTDGLDGDRLLQRAHELEGAQRAQSVVGITRVRPRRSSRGPGIALVVLGLVSLVLAVVNLFPFLPLDGGHIAGRWLRSCAAGAISLAAMWRFSSVGIVLLRFLVINGVGNDIGRLSG